MMLDPRIGYPILAISAISLILVLFTKADQVATLDRIENVENRTLVAIKQSRANYEAISEIIPSMNATLARMESAAPQSNFTAQAEAIANIKYLMDAVDQIEAIVNQTNTNSS